MFLHQLLSASALGDCIGNCADGDRVLLAGRGLEVLLDKAGFSRLGDAVGGAVTGLRADAQASGLEALVAEAGMPLVDDEDWPGLVATADQVLTWK